MRSHLHPVHEVRAKSLHTSQVAHQDQAYPGFFCIKQLGVFYSPLDEMLVNRRDTPLPPVANTLVPIYTPK